MRRVNSQSKCNSKCCCCGCLDNLRICLLADGSTCLCRPLRAACLLCRLPTLPLVFFLAPIPQLPSPPGKGEIFCFLMQGASPLASPRAEPGRHWEMGANHAPGGGLPCLLPANRAFSLLSCPHPPCPPSRREGGVPKLISPGASPPAPLH